MRLRCEKEKRKESSEVLIVVVAKHEWNTALELSLEAFFDAACDFISAILCSVVCS